MRLTGKDTGSHCTRTGCRLAWHRGSRSTTTRACVAQGLTQHRTGLTVSLSAGHGLAWHRGSHSTGHRLAWLRGSHSMPACVAQGLTQHNDAGLRGTGSNSTRTRACMGCEAHAAQSTRTNQQGNKANVSPGLMDGRGSASESGELASAAPRAGTSEVPEQRHSRPTHPLAGRTWLQRTTQ